MPAWGAGRVERRVAPGEAGEVNPEEDPPPPPPPPPGVWACGVGGAVGTVGGASRA